jgi:polyisoprenoid-binding protein YceI
VVNTPQMLYRAKGENEATLTGELTIRGVARKAALDVRYLGQWQTPWWEGGVDKGPKMRAGFVATTTIDRLDFGASWNASLEKDGLVVGNTVEITIDAEAILAEP